MAIVEEATGVVVLKVVHLAIGVDRTRNRNRHAGKILELAQPTLS